MGFSRQEHWSGLPFPSPGDLPDPEIELRSPELQADALPSEPPGKPPTVTGALFKSSGSEFNIWLKISPISDLSGLHCKMEIVALSCRAVHRSKCHKNYHLWSPALV